MKRSKKEIQAEFPGWNSEKEPTRFICSCGEERWGESHLKVRCVTCGDLCMPAIGNWSALSRVGRK
jgi:hypothetical protein